MTASPQVSLLCANINETQKALNNGEPGAREKLLNLAHSLVAAVELTSESIQRMGWAEVCLGAVYVLLKLTFRCLASALRSL